jgi:hypothetical protein
MLQLLQLDPQQCKHCFYSIICASLTVNSLFWMILKICTIHFNGNRIIAVLEKSGTLKIASVGDCGLKVIRKGDLE